MFRCKLPSGVTYHGNLGNWLAWQRRLYKLKDKEGNCRLDQDRMKLLQDLVNEGKLVLGLGLGLGLYIFRILFSR